jgi:hypothetical protein
MNLSERFRFQLHTRFEKELTTEETPLRLVFDEHEVTIKVQNSEQSLREAKWIIFSGGGFSSEAEAGAFAKKLRAAIDIAGLCTCNGINTGRDRASPWQVGRFSRQDCLIEENERLALMADGLSIHLDDVLTRDPVVSAAAVVTAQAANFIEALEQLSGQNLNLGDSLTGVRLLNMAKMEDQLLARLVLSLSAVEALGDEEKFTRRQAAPTKTVAGDVEQSCEEDLEALEVAEGIRKILLKLTIRQRVKRLLRRLGLEALQKDWDRLHSFRSGVLHGSVVLDDHELQELADETIGLCGKIVLSLVREQGVTIPTIADAHYFALAKGSRS